jgi:GntR family transcriptional regulator
VSSPIYVCYRSWTVGVTRGFTKNKLGRQSRLELLRENGIQLVKVEQVISAENATAQIAKDLGVEVGSALLSIRRIGYVESGAAVDVLDGLYNPQRFQYAMVSSLG